jgi:hypothetical protein
MRCPLNRGGISRLAQVRALHHFRPWTTIGSIRNQQIRSRGKGVNSNWGAPGISNTPQSQLTQVSLALQALAPLIWTAE